MFNVELNSNNLGEEEFLFRFDVDVVECEQESTVKKNRQGLLAAGTLLGSVFRFAESKEKATSDLHQLTS